MGKRDVPGLNSAFPEFQALTSSGDSTSLQKISSQGGVVLVLYRGWW